jgi:ferrochelatase
MGSGSAERPGVLLLQMGGPGSQEAVRPFLRRMLSDPAILAMPAAVRIPLATMISIFRAPRSRRQYAEIGGGSPIGAITAAQAEALTEALARAGRPMPVRVGMRYTEPSIADGLAGLAAAGADHVVILPLYPQWSKTTTGSSVAVVRRVLDRMDGPPRALFIEDWPDEPGYVAAVARTVRQALAEVPADLLPQTRILFSAHGLPVRYVEAGDPYPERVARTVAAVMARLGDGTPEARTCFQSRLGPVQWLEPSTGQAIAGAAADGVRALVVVPIAFVSDHLETLFEIDREYRAVAREAGIAVFARAPSLNDAPDFADALAGLVLDALAAGG